MAFPTFRLRMFGERRLCCTHIVRLTSPEELASMSKNNVKVNYPAFVIRHIWENHFHLIISWLTSIISILDSSRIVRDGQVCWSYLVGIKKSSCSFYFLALKGPTLELLRYLLRYWAQKKNVWCKNVYLLDVRKNSSHAHNTGSLYLLGAVFKISSEHPCPFCVGVPQGLRLTEGLPKISFDDKVEIVTISLGIKPPQK